MRHIDFNDNWRFAFAALEDWTNRIPGKARRTITLPHDFKLELARTAESAGGPSEAYYPGGVGFYEKTLLADETMAAGRVLLLFDGAYRITHVRVNRELAKIHKGGYTAFFADLTGKLTPGENTILITVDASLLPASRWYTGAGLYRGVTLMTSGPAHIKPWGVCVQTPAAGPDGAQILVHTDVTVPRMNGYEVRSTILDEVGRPVAHKAGKPGEQQAFTLNPYRLWSPDDPCLYTLRSDLCLKGTVIDSETTRFGIRTVQVDAQNGLMLNGRPIKLRGGCVHHDNGILGARSHPDAERRKVQKLKECGFNAIRCAHNPPSSVFLNACDELGMLVIDEAFDCWREGKKQLDDHIFFEDRWQAELEAMIFRDRNHPSVVFWSTGNEIVERCGISDGAAWSRRLAEKVRELDPTRPVTNAVCGFFEDPQIAEMAANSLSTAGEGKDFWAQRSEEFIAPLDVAGYNYLLDRYEKDHGLYPGRVLMGTESFPMQALENWQAVLKHPYVIGDFVWTAWDYLGESGIGHSSFDGPAVGHKAFPWHLANCGDLDICGVKRPQSHYRDFVWSGRTAPYITAQNPKYFGLTEQITAWGWPETEESWNYEGFEGKPVRVNVYAAGDTVELFLSGALVGRQPSGEEHRYTAQFEVPYQPGVLRAVALENGCVIGEAVLKTTEPPAAVRVVFEKEPEKIAPGGLLYAQIETVDPSGLRVPYADGELTVSASGSLALYALGSGDPQGKNGYTEAACHMYHGRALAVLQSIKESSPARLTVRYPGLPPYELDILL